MIAQCLNGPVKVGDMVRVVLPRLCCGSKDDLGYESVVVAIERTLGICNHCHTPHRHVFVVYPDGNGDEPGLLIRLDPPAIPDGIETVREVTA